jgi:hypothetical protein
MVSQVAHLEYAKSAALSLARNIAIGRRPRTIGIINGFGLPCELLGSAALKKGSPRLFDSDCIAISMNSRPYKNPKKIKKPGRISRTF